MTSRLQRIEPGDRLFLGRKPTGTLVTDALTPGSRLFLLATGTGLAPFLSLIRDPDIYERFGQVIVGAVARLSADGFAARQLATKMATSAANGIASASAYSCGTACDADPPRSS